MGLTVTSSVKFISTENSVGNRTLVMGGGVTLLPAPPLYKHWLLDRYWGLGSSPWSHRDSPFGHGGSFWSLKAHPGAVEAVDIPPCKGLSPGCGRPPWDSGGSPWSRGGSLWSRGGSPWSRGGSPWSRGGSSWRCG